MNPDTPSRKPRTLGTVARYGFALLAGSAFAWMAWNPQPLYNSGDPADRTDHGITHEAAVNRTVPFDVRPAVPALFNDNVGGRPTAITKKEAISGDAAGSAHALEQATPSAGLSAAAAAPTSDDTSEFQPRGPP